MKIWIDGDACPKIIKQILFRAAVKRAVSLYIVANHSMYAPASPFIKKITVDAGFDVADTYILTHLTKHDLVITADTILADLVIAKEAMALNPRGTLYSANMIKQVVSMRHFNESLRGAGQLQGGLHPITAKEVQNFSNHLDKILSQYHR